ncbi:unnamed protein product [Closterium sp. NIES-64]|nr:unnamed protein product [Closterium sp. NIES-64]CAI5993960.1 unnamed protein product [Closterium sp. NIES-65]
MERSVHREDKEKVLVRVNLGDHRENLEVESHGGEVYWVPLGKPLGIVFKEAPDGAVLVDELVPRGNADKADPPIQPGDRLLATSAWASDPNGQRQQVMFKAVGEPFDIVMAAIGSNSCAQCHVAVVLERQGKATRSE